MKCRRVINLRPSKGARYSGVFVRRHLFTKSPTAKRVIDKTANPSSDLDVFIRVNQPDIFDPGDLPGGVLGDPGFCNRCGPRCTTDRSHEFRSELKTCRSEEPIESTSGRLGHVFHPVKEHPIRFRLVQQFAIVVKIRRLLELQCLLTYEICSRTYCLRNGQFRKKHHRPASSRAERQVRHGVQCDGPRTGHIRGDHGRSFGPVPSEVDQTAYRGVLDRLAES